MSISFPTANAVQNRSSSVKSYAIPSEAWVSADAFECWPGGVSSSLIKFGLAFDGRDDMLSRGKYFVINGQSTGREAHI